MAAKPLAVVCAWCNRTIAAAPSGHPITHTICPVCLDLALAFPTIVYDNLTASELTPVRPPTGDLDDVFKH